MKKIRTLLALLLTALLMSSVFFFTEAEPSPEGEWQADLLKLMDPEDVPSTTEIQYESTNAEGEAIETHDIACEITVNGVTYGCEFVFEFAPGSVSDWTPVQNWLGQIVTGAARDAGSDSESLAKAIDRDIAAARRSAQPDESGAMPAWVAPGLNVSVIRVSTPFYPELSVGKNGDATKRLQARLIELGFLSGAADGYFGEQTKAAVEALEGYVRELEQDLIDARPQQSAAPTALPTQAPTQQASAQPAAQPEMSIRPDSKHELTLIPRESAAPSQSPTQSPTEAPESPAPDATQMDVPVDAVKLVPVTQVDGVADALLQAYIYSDAYQSARRALQSEDSGSDVSRLQQRLLNLGCTVGAPDGHYGADTARAVRVFQHYNGLEETGRADMDTLNLLFSAAARAPEHAMLSDGSTGDAVKALQTRLRELGFGNVSADGDYGAGTQQAVQNLQEYMRDREEAQLRAQDPTLAPDTDLSAQLTVEINGAADPLLLDAFYADSFPAIPAEMSDGSVNDDVVRVQRRLNGLEFFYGALDGHYGAQTETAITAFQKRNSLPQTGVADAQTLARLFSGEALKALKPYVLKISIDDQRVYAYGLDDNNEYTELVRTMKCSTGRDATPTPKGTFESTTGPGARWHYFKKFDCWAQYAYYIEGDILFHSVLYNEKDGPVTQSSVNNLGRKASHGCVRLSVEDAKWIYQNCPRATKVVVY